MITDDEIRAMVIDSLRGRQNSLKRTLRKDATAALEGDACSREAMEAWKIHAAAHGVTIVPIPCGCVKNAGRDTELVCGRHVYPGDPEAPWRCSRCYTLATRVRFALDRQTWPTSLAFGLMMSSILGRAADQARAERAAPKAKVPR